MAQAKIPVGCAECPEQGPRRALAAAAGWLRVSHGGQSSPRWLCPACRVPHEKIGRAAPPRRRPLPPAARMALALALMGVR